MKTSIPILTARFAFLALTSTCSLQPSALLDAASLGTAFTYQGRLNDGGAPANGFYDLRFILSEDAGGSYQVGPILTNAATGVSNGLFTVTLDFGSKAFNGDARWLEIGVRTHGSAGDFTPLSPRQPLTPSPYALYAANADTATTAANATAVAANGVANSSLQANAVTSDKIANGTIGAADVAVNTFWNVVGNAGTTAGTHFLGTTDNQPLELRVNGQRSLRLESTPSGGPNVIGGHWGNFAAGEGVTIAGGGSPGLSNRVEANYSFVGGGRNHLIQNSVGFSTIGGGDANSIRGGAYSATISGGAGQTIGTNSIASTIGGGQNNSILISAPSATISGGSRNSIQTNAIGASIGGGLDNTIQASAFNASISGGYSNTSSAGNAVIGGGAVNLASGLISTVGGGQNNSATNTYATVPGGAWNLAGGEGSFAAGRAAKSLHNGTFVWSDEWSPDFVSTGPRQFLIRAAGGVGIGTNAPVSALHVNGTVTANAFAGSGASLTGIGPSALADNSVNAAKIVDGSVGNAELATDAVTTAKIAGGTVVKSLNALKDDVALVAGTNISITPTGNTVVINTTADYWSLNGNGIPLGQSYCFLGTTTPEALEFRVNNGRALKLFPLEHDGHTGTNMVNLLAGSPANAMDGFGNTLAGGGASLYRGLPGRNWVNGKFATLSGGVGNECFGVGSTLSGGEFNLNHGDEGVTVAGGMHNFVQGRCNWTTISGGEYNLVELDTDHATVGGGQFNQIQQLSDGATVGGGLVNRIEGQSRGAFLGGGENNLIQTNAFGATIVGGGGNTIGEAANHSAVGGGLNNQILAISPWSSVGGGYGNMIGSQAGSSTIGGGYSNRIQSASTWATIAGGRLNAIHNDSSCAAVLGGSLNTVRTNGQYATVVGGLQNEAADFSFAAGRRAKAIHSGTFVWADALDADFASTRSNQFLVRATGGVGINKANPATALDVNGVVTATSFTGSGGGLTGIGLGALADNSVNAAKIIDGSVANADLADNAVTSARIADGTIGLADISPVLLSSTFWRLDGNAGTAPGAQFLGTTDSQPLEFRVNGARALRLEPNGNGPNVIGGFSGNAVGSGYYGSTIGGGGYFDHSSTISASYATIAGGYKNIIQSDANSASIGGGGNNTIESAASGATIAGGSNHSVQAGARSATISGGSGNTIGTNAYAATIGGGDYNTIQTNANRSAIGGGNWNTIQASASWATIGGGYANTNNGQYATIPGGLNNSATNYAFAAGRRAKAHHTGSFVWADSTDADFASTAANQFLIRASGGVGLGGPPEDALLDVEGDLRVNDHPIWLRSGTDRNHGVGWYSTGSFAGSNPDGPVVFGCAGGALGTACGSQVIALQWNNSANVGIGRASTANRLEVEGNASKTTAGSWLANSDRRIKTDIATVTNALETLAKVRLVSFRYTDDYRAAHPSVDNRRYVNVVAQEFTEVFPDDVKRSGEKEPGGDEILQVDTYPLVIYSAAAVQQLQQQLKAKDAEIQELKQGLAELKQLVQGLTK